jgi:tellurite resistance protein
MEDAFEEFVTTTWNLTMADGVVSEDERSQLREITRVLGLDPASLPSEWRSLLS